MDLFMYGLIAFIVLCTFFIWYTNTYNKYQAYIIRINEVEVNIDNILRKRFDLLNKAINIIKSNCSGEENILEVIVKLRSKKLTNFELDRALYEAINEFNSYKCTYPDLAIAENFIKIEVGLHESEAEIAAFRKYYNDIITEYNKLTRRFPSNIVAKICHYVQKTYFDGKDMADKIVNDFKL